MGTRPRQRPKHLAAKLLAIRTQLGLSQSQMAERLGSHVAYPRISEYEHGVKLPDLMTLLRYGDIAVIHLE
jgi:transcriptional regulator with XRE-family HTH domain